METFIKTLASEKPKTSDMYITRYGEQYYRKDEDRWEGIAQPDWYMKPIKPESLSLEEVQKTATKYTDDQFIDYGDLNPQAAQQIFKTFIDGWQAAELYHSQNTAALREENKIMSEQLAEMTHYSQILPVVAGMFKLLEQSVKENQSMSCKLVDQIMVNDENQQGQIMSIWVGKGDGNPIDRSLMWKAKSDHLEQQVKTLAEALRVFIKVGDDNECSCTNAFYDVIEQAKEALSILNN